MNKNIIRKCIEKLSSPKVAEKDIAYVLGMLEAIVEGEEKMIAPPLAPMFSNGPGMHFTGNSMDQAIKELASEMSPAELVAHSAKSQQPGLLSKVQSNG